MDLRFLMQAKRWVQNPPSWGRVKLIFGVLIVALSIAALEYFGLWPDWATTERVRRSY